MWLQVDRYVVSAFRGPAVKSVVSAKGPAMPKDGPAKKIMTFWVILIVQNITFQLWHSRSSTLSSFEFWACN